MATIVPVLDIRNRREATKEETELFYKQASQEIQEEEKELI